MPLTFIQFIKWDTYLRKVNDMKLVRKLTIILIALLLCIEFTVAGVYVNKIKNEYIESKIANRIIIDNDYEAGQPFFKEETELAHKEGGLYFLVKKDLSDYLMI